MFIFIFKVNAVKSRSDLVKCFLALFLSGFQAGLASRFAFCFPFFELWGGFGLVDSVFEVEGYFSALPFSIFPFPVGVSEELFDGGVGPSSFFEFCFVVEGGVCHWCFSF